MLDHSISPSQGGGGKTKGGDNGNRRGSGSRSSISSAPVHIPTQPIDRPKPSTHTTYTVGTETRYIRITETPVKSHTRPHPVQVAEGGGITPGAAAGVGIGCSLIGALVAALVVFVIMRRRHSVSLLTAQGSNWPLKDSTAASSGESVYGRGQEKMPATAVVPDPVSRDSSIVDLQHVLPPPIEHRQIKNELSALRGLIRNHLSNFYRTAAIEPQMLDATINCDTALAEIARDTPFSTKAWIELLANTKTRSSAVRFLIAWVLFNRFDLDCDVETTLLPPGLAATFTHMSSLRGGEEETEYMQSRWRVISGLLTKGQYEQRAFDGADDRWQNLQSTVRLLDRFLKPLAIEALNSQRLESLTEVTKRGAALGFTLASQPSSWIFDWDATSGNDGSAPLVLFPSLVQHTNDRGQRPPGQPLELGEKEIANSIFIQ